MKRAAVVVACVLVGLAAGGIWSWLQSDRYRADARVLVRPPTSRIVPAVEALAGSSLISQNIAQTLHLASPPKLTTKRGDSGVLTVSAEAGSRERARQIDAEAVVILTQKVRQRFPAAGVTTTVLDPAHVAEQTSPTPGRNLLITGVAGLVAGIALAAGLSVGRRTGPPDHSGLERRLQTRIEQVAKRERALAMRAGQLAAREHDLDRREEESAAAASRPSPADHAVTRRSEQLEQREREVVRRSEELDARVADLEEVAAAEPPPETSPAQAPPARSAGGWTLRALETLARERTQAGVSSEQQEHWSTYLFLLREHADADGALPASFDQLVNDVFGPLPQHDG